MNNNPTKQQILSGNRFRPAEYKKENLINFERKSLWMVGIERHKHPISGFKVFVGFCVVVGLYFVLRGLW